MKKKHDFTLDILGQTWKVFLNDDLPEGIAGQCDYDKLEIRIGKTDDLKSFLSTYFHELFHAMFQRISAKQTGLHPQAEEIIVDLLSISLTENFMKTEKALKLFEKHIKNKK
jgi:hypothetical protein